MDDQITIVEVSPRDGLSPILGGKATRKKISFINQLAKTGLKKIECVAFVHPRIVPENADAEKVMEKIEKKPGVTYVGLIQTEVGCRRALATSIDEILIQLATSDTFLKSFSGRTLKEIINNTLPAFFEAVKGSGKTIRIYIATAFGCPYIGKIPYDHVVQLVLKLSHMGTDEIILLDNAGLATPRDVKELIAIITGLSLKIRLGAHFHNTRGMGLANCLAAYEAGIRIFDASLGGMSKTPYESKELPLGYWNVPTEELVYMFEAMGVKTNINLDRLLDCVKFAEKQIKMELPGHLLRATIGSRLYKGAQKSKS
ncbi:MAG: hydroxymethylglutaryl-CoA lyase [Deltaproteobacteria bacterium]|nr:hydroxymethylglutaryl-CoA lyase [Deltaproteobacteria bacterium]